MLSLEALKRAMSITLSSSDSNVLRTRVDIPKLNVTNPRYHLAIKTWQKLPVQVTQVLGPFIARSIP